MYEKGVEEIIELKMETKEKLKQLVRLESFRLERDVSISEVLDDMMKQSLLPKNYFSSFQ